jgi:hypothetical protein
MIEETESLRRGGLRWTHVLLIILLTIGLTAGATYWLVRTYIYAKDFTPVSLKAEEEQILNSKLRRLGYEPAESATGANTASEFDASGRLRPERYSEAGASRDVRFSERELNGLLASNTDMARKLAIDLSDNLVSAKLLVPVDPDFPVLGGKTLRVNAGLEMAYQNARPIVILKGISIMGVPLPNAWLGGLKNIDLVSKFGDSQGFWKAFADGVDNIQVEEGELVVKLKE